MQQRIPPSIKSAPAGSSDNEAGASQSDDMYIVSGKVSMLYVAEGQVNVLQGMQRTMAAAGIGDVLAGLSGSVANAAMVSMYDGERVQSFGCYVGDQMVIGAFETIDFSDGEEVKAVVARLDKNAVRAHAVVRPSDGQLWMPHSTRKGRRAIAAWIAKLMTIIAGTGWAFLLLLSLAEPLSGGFVQTAALSAASLFGVSFLVGYLGYRSSIQDGLYAEAIMKVLGFKNPKIVDLHPFHLPGSLNSFDLRKALKAYDSLSKAKQS
jgi:hypothetical protein